MKKLYNKFVTMTRVMSLRSNVLSDYFYMLMTNHNIKSIRNGMKVLIFYSFCEVISSHMSERTVLFRPIVALIAFVIYFVFFASTVNVKYTKVMVRLSSLMVLLSMSYTMLLGSDTREVIETHYSLTVVTILMMFTLFRLRFMITMLMSVVYILIFVTLGNYKMNFNREINLTSVSEPSLTKVRAFHTAIVDKRFFLLGQCILFFLIYITGLYLRFFNSIRRKSAFIKLAQNAESKMKMNTAIQVQTYWIEAIMPNSVKDEFLKQSRNNKDMFHLVYCKKFENVSILFADIVGFTEMSSNKTAAQLVYLLNDLYNRFDEYSKITNCEKIGTLGDCYYCVSGCPIPRYDHAICCSEMGLGICRIILDFNFDHQEKVNMRVGVHSGRVTAAIIGNQRFRFDVFSNDVIIANSLETTGKAGFVHVSEDTYKLIRHAYMFEDGDLLAIKKEEEHGIAGFIEKIISIRTFFILPLHKSSTDSKSSPAEKKRMHVPNISTNQANDSNKRLSIPNDTSKLFALPVKKSSFYQFKDEKIKEDLEIIQVLQKDPDRPVDYFQNPPLNSFFLTFIDKEIEHHYLHHTTDQIEELHIGSIKTALLFDSYISLFYSSTILLAAYIMIPKQLSFHKHSHLIYCACFILTAIATFISLVYKSNIKNMFLRGIYSFFSHPISRLFLSITISSMPSILVLSLYNSVKFQQNYQYASAYFTLTLFALIGNSLSTTSYSLIKHTSTAFFTVVAITIMTNPFFRSSETFFISGCSSLLINQMNILKNRLQYHFTFQLIHICLLIYYLTRENEKNIRINFFVTREAEIRNAEALRAKKIAESLLYNIIPKHVFSEIVGASGINENDMKFSYAHAIRNAGVVFASVTNFFSKYYREDYKSGEVALKLLHTIICTFDNLLHKPSYRYLEKIKTINDCYMVASGLNTEDEESNDDEHLIALMNFALDIHYHLHLFNEKNIIGSSGFTLKIGYNFGPVTAGIIGTSKPLYDIWGDTVNVASRMYSSVPTNNIQVPDYVVDRLSHKFEFKYRGQVKIKGKGMMITYLVIRSCEKPHLFIRHADNEDTEYTNSVISTSQFSLK